MNDFWNNISRYPQFFISSLLGLILIILAPFKNVLKVPKLRIFALVLLFIFTIVLYLTIKTMVVL